VISLIRSELLKLRTARSFVVICVLGVVICALISLANAILTKYSGDDPDPGLDLIAVASTVLFFTLMLGVLTITTEYRHGSIASALLVEPDRRRLLAAKLVAVTILGAALGLLTAALCLCIGEAILPGRGYPLGLSAGQVLELLAGMTAAGGLTAALGAGVGALVRRQTAAVVGIILYLVLIEPLLTGVVIKWFGHYAIGDTFVETTGTAPVNGLADPFGQLAGGLLLLGWAALFAVIGAVVMQTRDVTD
jgi:ABC-type transport system involved in multi-copper enzyme maturation permease subunit